MKRNRQPIPNPNLVNERWQDSSSLNSASVYSAVVPYGGRYVSFRSASVFLLEQFLLQINYSNDRASSA